MNFPPLSPAPHPFKTPSSRLFLFNLRYSSSPLCSWAPTPCPPALVSKGKKKQYLANSLKYSQTLNTDTEGAMESVRNIWGGIHIKLVSVKWGSTVWHGVGDRGGSDKKLQSSFYGRKIFTRVLKSHLNGMWNVMPRQKWKRQNPLCATWNDSNLLLLNMCAPTSYFNRENCDKDAAKVLRKYYKRPYFLPPMAEAVEGNWFIVSSAQNMTLHVSSLFCK